jgi:hypothetical protein
LVFLPFPQQRRPSQKVALTGLNVSDVANEPRRAANVDSEPCLQRRRNLNEKTRLGGGSLAQISTMPKLLA